MLVVLMGPYSWLSFGICTAYADSGSFCFIGLSEDGPLGSKHVEDIKN